MVAQKLRKVLNAMDTGQVIPTGKETLERFLAKWLKDVKCPGVRPLTYEGYERIVRIHINPKLGKIPLNKLRPDQVQGFLTQKGKDGLSRATVRSFRVLLVGALQKALAWGLVARNVAALTDAPHLPKTNVKTLTLDECKMFMKALEGEFFEASLVVMLTAGLRRGELLGLTWDNVDVKRGSFRCVRTSNTKRRGLVLVPRRSQERAGPWRSKYAPPMV